MKALPDLRRACLVLAICLGVPLAAAYAQTGTVTTFPYPKWYFSPHDSSAKHLMFRLFGNEVGVARNLVVLVCKKRPRGGAMIELMPPMALANRLHATAPKNPAPTSVSIYGGVSASGKPIFESRAEYDQIAAFFDVASSEQVRAFLDMFEHEKLLVRWQGAKIEYLLWANRVYIDLFSKNFAARLQQEKKYQELSAREVYARCTKFWQ